MGRSFDKGVWIGLGLFLVLLVGIATVTYQNTRHLSEDVRWVVHSHEVHDLTNEVLLTIVDAETGQRGFLLTGEDDFLKPYDEALARLGERLKRLKDRVKDNAEQKSNVASLESMTEERIELLKQGIALRRKSQEAAFNFIRAGLGKAKMDAIRVHVDKMQDAETALLSNREMQSAASHHNAVTGGVVTASLGLLLLGAFVWILDRSLETRQNAAKRLQDEREWLHTTLASIGDAVIATDIAGRVEFLNPVAQALTGWSQEIARGESLESVFKIVNEQSRAPVENPAFRALREGMIVGLANRAILLNKDGKEFPIDDIAAPIKDSTGKIIGVVLVFRDVTERRQWEQAQEEIRRKIEKSFHERTVELKVSEERFRIIVEGTRDYAIFMLDSQGHVVSWNIGAERIKQYRADEIIGQHFSRFYPPEDIAAGKPDLELRIAMAEGKYEEEGWRLRKDGTQFWANVMITALRDDAGNLIGFSKITRDVTERMRAEASARDLVREEAARKAAEEYSHQIETQREELRVTLESIGDAVVSTDAEGRVVFLNAMAQQLTGWNVSIARGRPLPEVFEIINEDTRLPVENPALRALREGVIVGLANHTILVAKDGSERPIDDSAAPIRDATGTLVGSVLVFRDITERKQLERSIRESEERFRSLMEQAPFSIQVFSPDGRTLRVNKTWEELWGLTYEQIQDYNVLTDRQLEAKGVMSFIKRAFTGEATHIPTILYDPEETFPDRTRHQNAKRWVAAVAYPLKNEAGKILEIVLVHDDITARKSIEEAFEATQGLYRAIGESIDYGVWVCDPQGKNIYASESFLRLVGLTQEECSEFGWGRVLHPDDTEKTITAWKECVRTGDVWDMEHRFRGVDGEWHHVLARGVPVKNERGEITAWAGINLDIRRQKQVEQELRAADRRKDEFLATLAHELRNPLAPIRNSLQILKMPRVDPETAQQTRDMLERQVHHLVRLVDDLLDVSRVMRGKIELRKEAVELATIVARAVETAKPLIEVQGHQLDISLTPDSLLVYADPVRLTQVVGNLLTNSAKYTDANGHIWLTAERQDDSALLVVRDDGIGIAADMLPHVFDLFVQADHASTKAQGGLGIGLTLVKNLVEMHNGSVEAHSLGLGKGSGFMIRLPLLAPRNPHANLGFTSERGAKPALKGHRLLVVDDNRDAAISLFMLLQLQGHDVQVAHDGPAAIEVATRFRPMVIFLDIGMPGMDGYEVARRIRAVPGLEKTILAALTGWGQQEDRRRSAEAGFDHHLVKPPELSAIDNILAAIPKSEES